MVRDPKPRVGEGANDTNLVKKRLRVSAISVVLSVTILCAQTAERYARPLSVCELVAHRIEYNGHLVAVRGEEKGGPHGDWLAPDSECQYKLITRGVEWSNFIFMTYPANRSPDVADHANFKVDWTAIKAADAQVRRAGFNPETDRLIETYAGRFVTYLDLENRVNPGIPGALKLGFGPVGLEAPARLVIKTVKDVVIVPKVNQTPAQAPSAQPLPVPPQYPP
jgi:hypothetical protein